ncbi:MAG: transporter [candidate division Zixibacteria bacterium]|nr:transporter [candidate division Zixibacteria bacterium]
MKQRLAYNLRAGEKIENVLRKQPGYLMSNWRNLIVAVAACAFLFPLTDALAQGPPINTDTPIMLGVSGGGIRSFGKITRKTTLLRDGKEIADTLDRSVTSWVTPVAIPYNLYSDKLQIGLILPYVNMDLHKTTGDFSSSGIGDIKLSAKYLVYQLDRKNKTVRVASKAGVKLPTGNEDTQPALGTGSTDYFFSTVAGWLEKRVGVFIEGIYNVNTSKDSLDFGNSFSYNLALGYRLLPTVYETYPSPQINGYLELNGTTVAKSEVNGAKDDNSGGTILFLSPGLQYIGGRGWLVETSFQYPIINQPNGTQLATDWTLSFGTRVLVF